VQNQSDEFTPMPKCLWRKTIQSGPHDSSATSCILKMGELPPPGG
jgi:hypothetical protein